MNIQIKKNKALITACGGSLFFEKSIKSADVIFLYGTKSPFILEREIIKYFNHLNLQTFDASKKTLSEITDHISLNSNKKIISYFNAGNYIYDFLQDINPITLSKYETINIVFPNFTENANEILSILKKLFFFNVVAYVVQKNDIELTLCKDVSVRSIESSFIDLNSTIENFF